MLIAEICGRVFSKKSISHVSMHRFLMILKFIFNQKVHRKYTNQQLYLYPTTVILNRYCQLLNLVEVKESFIVYYYINIQIQKVKQLYLILKNMPICNQCIIIRNVQYLATVETSRNTKKNPKKVHRTPNHNIR